MSRKLLFIECKCDSLIWQPAPRGCWLLQATITFTEAQCKANREINAVKNNKRRMKRMNKYCVDCLCHYCTRSRCRYSACNTSVCYVRCLHVDEVVNYLYKPVTCCDRFVHKALHKKYKIASTRSERKKTLETISLKDFLSILGGGNK